MSSGGFRTTHFQIRNIRKAYKEGKLISNIGYKQNIEIIKQISGIRVKFNIGNTSVENGDKMLIMRLKYRADFQKGSEVNPEDFEYFIASYTGF